MNLSIVYAPIIDTSLRRTPFYSEILLFFGHCLNSDTIFELFSILDSFKRTHAFKTDAYINRTHS